MNGINSSDMELVKGMAPALLGIMDALLTGKPQPFENPWDEAQAMRYLIKATKEVEVMSRARNLAKARLRELQNANAVRSAAELDRRTLPKLIGGVQNDNVAREARLLGKKII